MKSKKVALNIQAGRKMIRCMSVDRREPVGARLCAGAQNEDEQKKY